VANRFGILLRQWRALRGLSQLDLAIRAGTSQRHVSFVESGRAQPSRQMVLKLVETLDVPLRTRNEVLVAAGYAPVYTERPLQAEELRVAYQALERILAHHEPYPAMVLDGGWNILLRNTTSAHVMRSCADEAAIARLSPDGKLNFMRMMFAPQGMRAHVLSWAHTGPLLIARLRREANAQPGSPSEQLLTELCASGAVPASAADCGEHVPEPVILLELAIGEARLRLFNMITTFGTPQDITLQELRIEMSFPADPGTDQFLRQWAASEGDPRADSASLRAPS
jgi:transcriptional regulator with XRE-family HTH domain